MKKDYLSWRGIMHHCLMPMLLRFGACAMQIQCYTTILHIGAESYLKSLHFTTYTIVFICDLTDFIFENLEVRFGNKRDLTARMATI